MNLEEEWAAALVAFETATDNLATKRPALWSMERNLAAMESEVVANGGIHDRVIDGKNEEQRKAQLRSILNEIPSYRAAQEQVDKLKAFIGATELNREVAAEQMRRCRQLIAFAESENLVAAYAGGANTQRRYSTWTRRR